MSDREGPQSRTTEHDKFQQGGMNYSSPPLESAGEEYSDSERPVKRSRSGSKRGPAATSSKRRDVLKDKKETGISERVLEARKDFDKALEKIKTTGSRRRGNKFEEQNDPIDLDEIASNFRRRMENAAATDNESVQANRPALAKHKMLPEVTDMLTKKNMHEIFLDSGILTAVRLWLEPLPNRSLPAVHLRRTLLELLREMPIETDHLRESQIGRIIMFFSRRSREAPDISRLAKDLVSRWSRPIIGDRMDLPSSPIEAEDRTSAAPPTMLQSVAFKEMTGRLSSDGIGMGGLSSQHRKLVMHMQKKSRSKKTL